MAMSQIDILKSGSFDTLIKGGTEIRFPLPKWFPTEHTAGELSRMVERFGTEAIMGLVIAQLLITMRSAVRLSQRTERETKEGIEKLTPKTADEVSAMLEALTLGGPAATQAKRVAKAKKLLSGFTPEQLAELLRQAQAEAQSDDDTDE